MLEDAADLTFRFYLTCPHCGEEQVPVFGFDGIEYGLKWDNSLQTNEAKSSSAYYQCCHCPEHFTIAISKNGVRGRWIAEDCTRPETAFIF